MIWVQLLVGVLIGYIFARLGNEHRQSTGTRMLWALGAAAMTIAVTLSWTAFTGVYQQAKLEQDVATDESAIVSIAYDLASNQMDQGVELTWPKGQSLGTAAKPDDFPSVIQRQAEGQWKNLSDDQKAKYHAARRQVVNNNIKAVTQTAARPILSYLWPLVCAVPAVLIAGRFWLFGDRE